MLASAAILLDQDWVIYKFIVFFLYYNDCYVFDLDLEFETDANLPAPEPALYETAYVTSHKGNCRAGCFSSDGQLIATGSVDASIKVSDV